MKLQSQVRLKYLVIQEKSVISYCLKKKFCHLQRIILELNLLLKYLTCSLSCTIFYSFNLSISISFLIYLTKNISNKFYNRTQYYTYHVFLSAQETPLGWGGLSQCWSQDTLRIGCFKNLNSHVFNICDHVIPFLGTCINILGHYRTATNLVT